MQDKVKDLGGETKILQFMVHFLQMKNILLIKITLKLEKMLKVEFLLGNVYVIKEGEFTKEFPLIITSESALSFINLDNYSVVLNFDLGITYYRVNKQMKLEHLQMV